jgi:hypothetical protein
VAKEVVVHPYGSSPLPSSSTAWPWADALLTGSGDAFEKLAAAGYSLRLNTAAEAAALEAGARTVTDKAEADDRAARLAGRRDENASLAHAWESTVKAKVANVAR